MTVDTTVNLNELDLADPDIYTAPDSGLGVLHYLQEHQPMFWNKRSDGPSFWAFTKYADGVAVYLDKTNFTSERACRSGRPSPPPAPPRARCSSSPTAATASCAT